MKVIVGYERSGVVAAAFRARGHEAISVDTEPYNGTERNPTALTGIFRRISGRFSIITGAIGT